MRGYLWTSVALLSLAAGGAWSAKPKAAAKPAPATTSAVMQAVGTFDNAQPTAKLSITVAPDEFEPGSFTIKASKQLTGVTVKLAGDLSSGKIAQAGISAVDGDQLVAVASTDLQKGNAKRYWITFDVPARTAPGTYTGEITAISGGKPVGKLPVELTVLPMRLLKSSKQYGYTLQSSTYGDTTYNDKLRKLPQYGFSLTSASTPISELPGEIKSIRDAGLGSTIPYFMSGLSIEDIAAANDVAKAAGVNRVYYATCSGSTSEQALDNAVAICQNMRERRIRTFAVVDDAAAYDKLGLLLDYTNLNMNLPYVQGLIAGDKRINGRHDWVYWNMMGDAKTNRLNAGLLLWKSGLDGAFLPGEPAGGDNQTGEPLFTTIQGEALREGVDDTRYLTTLMAVLREVKDGIKAGEVKNSGVANQAVSDTETYLAAALSKPLKTMSNKEYQDVRVKLAQFAIKLQSTKK